MLCVCTSTFFPVEIYIIHCPCITCVKTSAWDMSEIGIGSLCNFVERGAVLFMLTFKPITQHFCWAPTEFVDIPWPIPTHYFVSQFCLMLEYQTSTVHCVVSSKALILSKVKTIFMPSRSLICHKIVSISHNSRSDTVDITSLYCVPSSVATRVYNCNFTRTNWVFSLVVSD